MRAREIAEALDAQRTGKSWKARCPAHDDKKPSLSIDEGDGGKALLRCFAGCKQADVIEALRARGLWSANGKSAPPPSAPKLRAAKWVAESFPESVRRRTDLSWSHHREVAGLDAIDAVTATRPKPTANAGEIPAAHPTLGKPTASWIYRDEQGEPVAVVMRFETATGKEYRPYDLLAGAWTMSAPRPLYRLDELAARPGEPVVIVEGEKCADALAGVGVLATTVMGGAKAVGQADLGALTGRPIYLWRDADIAGEKWLGDLLGALRDLSCSVFIVPIPEGVRDKWDAADAIAEDGWTAERVGELIAAADPPARKLRGYTLDELLALDIPPREHMLEPWLHAKSVCMVHSWRGVGKTFFALNVAYAVASGGQFLRWKAPKPRKVLYIDGEMAAQDIKSRLEKIAASAEAKLRKPEDLVIIGADMQDNPMPDLTTPEGRAALDEWLADGFEFVVIDNLSTLTSGAENEDEAWIPMQQLALALRRRGIGVLFVHHSGKTGKQRGTSKREDIAETVISLRHPADYKHNEGLRFEIYFEKKRGFHGVEAEPVEAALDTDQDGKARWTTRTVEDAQRRHAIELLRDGSKPAEVAVEVGVSRATVFRWQRDARASGLLE